MSKKLYVGNLAYEVTEEDIRKMFADLGSIESVALITDRDTGRSKGFAFVEMENDEEAAAAIEQLNGKDFEGRTLNVSEARPREERPRGRGGYGGGGGGGGGYGRPGRY